MQVKSFECAIARSQIGRFLAGESLHEEAMSQLEAHIAGCRDCQRLIDLRREEIRSGPAREMPARETVAPPQEALAEAALSGQAVTATPPPAPSAPSTPELPSVSKLGARALLGGALARLPRLTRPVAPASDRVSKTTTRPKMGRVALYGAGLAATLAAMTALGDPTGLLGSKAVASAPPSRAVARTPVRTTAPRAEIRAVPRAALGVPITDAAEGVVAKTAPGSRSVKPTAVKPTSVIVAQVRKAALPPVTSRPVGKTATAGKPMPSGVSAMRGVAKAKPQTSVPTTNRSVAVMKSVRKPVLTKPAAKAQASAIQPATPQPAAQPASQPTPQPTPQRAARRSARRPARRAVKRRVAKASRPASRDTIRIYDETGQAVK